MMQNQGWFKALIMQRLMFSGSLDWLHTHKQQMMMNKTLNTQKQNQEILSWFSDDDRCLYQRSYTNDRCTMPSRDCTYGFPAESMIAPQSLSLQRLKDTLYTFDEVTTNFKEGKQKTTF